MADRFILPLATVGLADRARVGGKAVHLGELMRTGLPVPAGFCLTTEAYHAMVAHAGLADPIAAALFGLDIADPGALQRAAAAVRAVWDAAILPDALAAGLDRAYRDLVALEPDGPVAVRSSATIEDEAGASFAGQGETFLNVRGTAALHAAVKGCWASFWSVQALAYRGRHRSPHPLPPLPPSSRPLPPGVGEGAGGRGGAPAPGVLVQRMVSPDAAGVLFTADPVTGETDRVMIEAVPGLGEALVQGAATPERYVLSRPDLAVREWAAVPGRAGAVLNPVQAQDLARLGLRAEALFGAPQDVEWALAGGTLAVLQSRPITTTAPVALGENPALPPLIPQMLAERFPEPPTPFDISLVLEPLMSSVGAAPQGWLRSLPFVEQDGVVIGFNPSGRFAWGLLPRLATLLALSLRYRPEAWFQQELPRLERNLEDLEAVDLASRTDEELVQYLHTVSQALEDGFRARWRYVAASLRTMAPLLALLRLVEGPRAQPTLGDLLGGVSTVTVAIDAELRRLAQQIRAAPRLAALFREVTPEDLTQRLAQEDADPGIGAFRRALAGFLAKYGSRETGGPGAANPSWADDPAVILATLASLAQGEPSPPASLPQGERGGYPSSPLVGEGVRGWGVESVAPAQAARDRVLAHLEGAPLRSLRSLFLEALHGAREAYRQREDSHFHLMRFLPLLRRGALELGRRWAARGLVTRPEDIFLLKLEELEGVARGGLEAGPLVERRAWRRIQAQRRWASYGVEAAQVRLRRSGPGAVLRATGASGGVVEGRARIIRQQRDFHRLRPGEILVAPYTSPSWTPLFAVAAGLVVETGAMLSHAAIVAREYGIPAVVGLAGATHLLHDGELLAVDGAQGTVRRLEAIADAGAVAEDRAVAQVAKRGGKMLPWMAVGVLTAGVLALLARRSLR